MRKILFPFIVLIILLQGCNLINPEESIPAYIKVDEVSLQLPAGYDNPSHNIIDAHIFVGSDFLGVFEIPCEVPVLQSGNQTVRIFAGINSDGLKTIKHSYLFYKRYSTELQLIPESVFDIKPVFTYEDDIYLPFRINEDFETATLTFEKANGDPLQTTIHPDTAFGGGKSGIIYNESPDIKFLDVRATEEYVIPVDGKSEVYLEIDYKSSIAFQVGVWANPIVPPVVQEGDLTLKPNDNWTKIYINLTEECNRHPNGTSFRVFFAGFSETQGDYIALDNIRLVSWE